MNARGTNGYKWPLPAVYVVHFTWSDYGKDLCSTRVFQTEAAAEKWKPRGLQWNRTARNVNRDIRKYQETW